MKKHIIRFSIITILTLFASVGFTQPPPPPSDAGHGASGNQTGGNAPVGGGLFILMGLGAAYGGRKLYKVNCEELEE
ncbi:MAG: hypothetical protein DRJ09_12925 [Bacteroidetes bacterium]|nr:MAG: hypothetical protein DRJ09_12925 [Bacteroidota bacterium]